MEITLRQIRYLVALADEGHFGRAAAAVNVSQPALSVQIREMETALGGRLVERRSRSVVVTPFGREVVRRARRIAQDVRELRQVARWERGLGGRLRLGVIPTVAPYLLPAALPALRSRDLALDLGVREARTGTLLQELDEGALDAIVVALPVEGEDLVTETLFDDKFLLAGSDRQIAALAGARPKADSVDPERLLLLDEGHCLADQTLAACALSREDTRLDLRAASLSTLCRLVSEGFGLTFVPEIAVRAETGAAPGLAVARFGEPQPGRRIGLVRRKLSVDDGWFTDLAAILRAAGAAELTHARGAGVFAQDKAAERR
jgi:LysR family hydrogen peroxide-inducible transcriptional activator